MKLSMVNDSSEIDSLTEQELGRIVTFIHQQKGVDLSCYRQSFLQRRLRVRLLFTKAKNSFEYINLIKNDPEEFNNFLDTLGVNVTEFFRDQEAFTAFKKTAVTELIKRKETSNSKLIRVWSAACASGEEAYSIAILLKEVLAGRKDFTFKIWGTDMDKSALLKAEQAEYKANDLKKLDKKILENYFNPVYNNLYQLKDEIKQLVNFQQNNLLVEEPLKFLDIIFCRNMMIYLNRDQQKILINKYHQALNNKGYLVVGKVENVWDRELFQTIDPKEKIYQKIG